MRSVIRYTLGIAVAAQVGGALPVVAAQAAGPTACSLFDAAELKRLTGRKDVVGRGPQADETPANGLSECEFLGLHFTVWSNMTPERFRETRDRQVKLGMKTEPVSGVGDEAYYLSDPRPGSYRAVGVVYRSGARQVTIGDMVPSDSIAATKPMLLSLARLTLPKVKR